MDNHYEIDIEDSEYGQYFNNLEQLRYRPAAAAAAAAADDDDELKNREYSRFIENLKEDEVSYSVEFQISSDISIVLRYEGEEEESFENVDGHINFMSNSKREKAKVQGNSVGFSGKTRTDTPKTMKKSLIGVEGGKKRLGDVSGPERKRDDENKLEEGAEADPVSCKSSGGSSKLMNRVVKDESQEEVPDSTHHKNGGSCPEVEVFTLDNMPLLEGDYMPFVPSKCFAGEEYGDGVRGSSPSEKLMDLLKIPYNEQELSNLSREVTKRKPVQGVKELRHGRMKSYSTKTEGKSYLDWYKELRMKVEEFKDDRRKLLYLLRGFFFWLKNTAHEGAFQPWRDSLYLKGLDRAEVVWHGGLVKY